MSKLSLISSNFLGTILDKGLPLLIGLILSKYMTSHDFGLWSLFYQFLLILNAVSISPILGFFNRKFFQQDVGEQKMYLYNYKIVLLYVTTSAVIYYGFFAKILSTFFYEVLIVLGFIIYLYFTQFLRFKNRDSHYLLVSFLRILVFVSCSLCFLYFYKSISYQQLLLSFLCAHIIPFIWAFPNLSINSNVIKGEQKEFVSLSTYGLLTSSVNGIDKFLVIGLGNSLAFLGLYSYLYTVSSSVSILVEAGKKIFTPKQFKEFNNKGRLSSKTKKMIIIFLIFISLIQMLIPVLLFYSLSYFNLINNSYSDYKFAYKIIFIFSFGLMFFNAYHFINPYLIFFKKSIYLTFSLLVSIVVYISICLLIIDSNNIVEISLAKIIMLILSTLITFVMVKKIKNGFNKNI